MKSFIFLTISSVLSIVFLIGVTHFALAQNTGLSTPVPVATQAASPLGKHKTRKISKALRKQKTHPTPTALPTSTPTSSIAQTPTPTPTAGKPPTQTPTPNRTTSPVPTPKLPAVTTIPNPAYGDKVIFRVMAKGTSKAQVVVYDRFFTKVTELSGEGDRLFDILWSLKKVQQGLYYYQTQVTDSTTGQAQMLPMQSFAVMKDDLPTDP